MITDAPLTAAHVGKFTVIRAGDRNIPVQIISVGGGLCGCSVLDINMPMRSVKVRYDEKAAIRIYDTAEEAAEGSKLCQT